MRRHIFLLFVLACAASGFDRGGVSFDYRETAFPKPRAVVAAKNLLQNGGFENGIQGWTCANGSPGSSREELKRMMPLLGQCTSRTVVTEGGRTFLRLHSGDGIRKLQDAKGRPMMTNVASQRVPIPHAGHYSLTFRASGYHTPGPGVNNGLVIVSFLDARSKRIAANQRFRLSVTRQWQETGFALTVPEGTAALSVAFYLYGAGELNLDDIALTETAAQPIEARLYPMGFLDNRFHLASGMPGMLMFAFRNPSGLELRRLLLHLRLPGGVAVAGGSRAVVIRPEGDGQWCIDMTKARFTSSWFAAPPVIISTSLAPRAQPLEASFRIEHDGKTGPEQRFQIVVIPPFTSPQPRHFLTGFYSAAIDSNYTGTDAELIAQFYRHCGFNFEKSSAVGDLAHAFRRAGFLRARWPYATGPSNGYDMGGNAPKPPEIVFRKVDGSPIKGHRTPELICPVAVYKNSEYYRREVLAPIRHAIVDQGEYEFAISNWEPQINFQGCFCERCREEFIQYTKLDAATVRAAWPREVLSRWRERWQDFRSWQHGRMVARVAADVAALGKDAGRETAFLPAVTSAVLREAGFRSYPEYNSLYFIGDLPWLNAWGPYIYHDIAAPYAYRNAEHLKSFLNAREAQRFLDRHLAPGARRPKLIAYPANLLATTWMTPPEAAAFETLCYFLQRWEGSALYFLPFGCDHRWFREMAAANRLIAATDAFVFQGKPVTPPEAIPVTGLPRSYYADSVSADFPELPGCSFLQTVAWQKDAQTLLAVGNFWERGECFFRLRIPGLEPKREYRLRTPDGAEEFAREDGRGFTGSDLEKGVLMQVGALRWRILILEAGVPAANAIRSSQVEAARQAAEAAIARALADEAEELRLSQGDARRPDYAALKPLANGRAKLTPAPDGTLRLAAPGVSLTLDLAKGGCIRSWKVNGREYVGGPAYSFGSDATWGPSFVAKGFYRVNSMRAEGEGFSLDLEHQVVPAESTFYSQLLLRKRIILEPRCIRIRTEVTNRSGDSVTFRFRWFSLPLALKRTLTGPDGDIPVQRTYDVRAWRLSAAPEPFKIPRRTEPAPTRPITVPAARFAFEGATESLAISAAPADHFDAFVVWDGSGQPSPTFEAIYHPETLTAGQKSAYEIEYQIQ